MSLKRVYSFGDLTNPGDYLVTDNGNGTKGMVWVCLGCKQRVATKLGLIVTQEEPLTLSPSVWCQHEVNGVICNWHHHITNGVIS